MKKLQVVVIVPLGLGASQGDQIENANYFLEKGYRLKSMNLNQVNLQVYSNGWFAKRKDVYLLSTNGKSAGIKICRWFYEILKQDINKGKKWKK